MQSQKLAEVMDNFARSVGQFADELRNIHQDGRNDALDDYQDDYADDDQINPAPHGREIEEVDLDGLTPDSDVDVNIGDLWRLVNGARYMVRMAREGKVPTMDQRGPLDRAIKTLKAEIPALRKGGIGRLMRG